MVTLSDLDCGANKHLSAPPGTYPTYASFERYEFVLQNYTVPVHIFVVGKYTAQQFITTKIHNYTTTQIHKYTNTQIHKYTNTQIHSMKIFVEQTGGGRVCGTVYWSD